MINKIKTALPALFLILMLAGCFKRDDATNIQVSVATGMAYLKFVNVYTALNPSGASPATGPSVNIYVNNNKINATAVSYAGLFPAAPAYAGVTPGLATNIKVVLSRVGPQLPGDTIISKNYDLPVNSYSSIFLVDSLPYATPLNPNVLFIPESISNAPIGYFRARFINMIPSTDTLEVFSKVLQTVIFSGTLYKNGSNQVELPVMAKSDTLQLRKVSAPLTVLAELRAFVPTSARVYTVYCNGLITSSSGSRARTLTSFTNR